MTECYGGGRLVLSRSVQCCLRFGGQTGEGDGLPACCIYKTREIRGWKRFLSLERMVFVVAHDHFRWNVVVSYQGAESWDLECKFR